MHVDIDLSSMHLNFLRNRCAEESDRFFRRQEHDPRFCFEIFRRAIQNRDEKAWECIYHQYQSLVASWVKRHSLFQALDEDCDYFASWAFEKMWAVLTPEKFTSFPDLKSILRYLQMCVHSVLTDAMRAQQQAGLYEVDLEGREDREDSHQDSPEEQVFQRSMAEDLLATLYEKCSNAKERRIVYASFVLGMKPGDIFEVYGEEFQNTQEVYRVKENLLARLKRDREFIQYLTSIQDNGQ